MEERAIARGNSVMAATQQDKEHRWQRALRYPAGMRQQGAQHAAPPRYTGLLGFDEAQRARLAERVARDVAPAGDPDEAELAASRMAVDWLLATLERGPVPAPDALRPLRDGAAAEARAGGTVQPVIDRALSAGWVVWAAVLDRPAVPAPELAALGEALLRTGDAAAAAIADAHAAAEREIATRSASALRELLDQLLELPERDELARARLGRRLAEAGIQADRPLVLVLADAGRDLQDGDPVIGEIARTLAGGGVPSVGDPRALGGPVPAPVVAATRGRLLLLLPAGRRPIDPRPGLERLGAGWSAVTVPVADLPGTAAALREATAALVVALRLGGRERPLEAASLLLERSLLAEPALLAAALQHELGALERAPRGSALIGTLEAFFAERENLRAAARRLGVAPRTVAYRLARIERLLGGPLDADRRLRLATALFARRLAVPAPDPGHAARRGTRISRAAGAARPR